MSLIDDSGQLLLTQSGVLNYMIMILLSQFWGLIQGLQISVYMILFNVKMPANVTVVLAYLIVIACFDMLNTDEYNERWFGLTEHDNVSPQFAWAGF